MSFLLFIVPRPFSSISWNSTEIVLCYDSSDTIGMDIILICNVFMIRDLTDSEHMLIDVDVKLYRDDGTTLETGLTKKNDATYTTTMKMFGLSGTYSCLTTAKPFSPYDRYLTSSKSMSQNSIMMRAGTIK